MSPENISSLRVSLALQMQFVVSQYLYIYTFQSAALKITLRSEKYYTNL